jgi:predicted restriction endonuclease
LKKSELPATEKEALVKSRRGQGRFRADLFRTWNGRCAVTGIDIVPLLRASHIKPWSSSNNKERLDPMNGLLLASNHDAAFDAGIISFDDSGCILFSDVADQTKLAMIGIGAAAKLSKIEPDHVRYLAHHRDCVVKSASE